MRFSIFKMGFSKQDYADFSFHFSPGFKKIPQTIEEAFSLSFYKEIYEPFACYAFHKITKEFFLVRDHLGLEPLFYSVQDSKVEIASNLPDLLAVLPKRPAYCLDQVNSLYAASPIYRDETLYEGIFRVEPAHAVRISHEGKVSKVPYWSLDRNAPFLNYRKSEDYLAHFTSLLQESLRLACKDEPTIAAEFSAGLDSSAIVAAAVSVGIRPKLYLHAAFPQSEADQIYDRQYETEFLKNYSQCETERIDASGFDPIHTLKSQSQIFAGAAPYLFSTFAMPVLNKVKEDGHKILLSGFGGDQGISGPVPNHILYSSRIQKLFSTVKNLQNRLRDYEWNLLQGPQSHEVRHRIESCSLITKPMGIQYRYPLLYPKLLEFYFALPLTEKRNGKLGRWLLRRYLAQELGTPLFHSYQKRKGLSIMSAAFDSFRERTQVGEFASEFKGPLDPNASAENSSRTFAHQIRAYMMESSQS